MNLTSPLFVAIVLMLTGLANTSMGQEDVEKVLPKAIMPSKHAAVFQKYCYECHDTSSQEGNIDLEAIPFEVSTNIVTAERWAKVLNAINSGEMPPKDSEQISATEKTAFLADLSDQMVIARKILSDSGGVITMRRLNRREYKNSIEALLGIPPDVTDLPDDQASTEYDTTGASLFFSSDQLEQYLATAEKTLKLALRPRTNPKSKTVRIEPEEYYTNHYRTAAEALKDTEVRAAAYFAQKEKPPSEFGFLDEYQVRRQRVQEWLPLLNNYLERPETKTGTTLITTIKQGGTTKIKLPPLGTNADGKYTIRLRAAHYPDAEERFHYLEFSTGIGKERTRLGWRRVTATLDNPEIIEFPFEHLPGRKHQIWINQRTHQDRGDKNLATDHMKVNGLGTPPGIWIDWAEQIGPHPEPTRVDLAASILFPKPEGWNEKQYAKEVLRRFAVRAFRGEEPDPDYLNRLVERYFSNRKLNMSVRESMIKPLAIVLSSPSFMYLVESTGNTRSPLLTPKRAGHATFVSTLECSAR